MTAPRETFWSVDDAVDISPPPKLMRVEVATPVYVVACVNGNAKVAAPSDVAERQLPLIAKQPLVRLIPFAPVDVPLKEKLFAKRFVEEALPKSPVVIVDDALFKF